MRSGRAALLALALVAIVLIVCGAVLFTSTERPAGSRGGAVVEQAADQVPLGEFVPQSPPRPAPQINLTDTSGNVVSLADFGGKVVLLNLWATWCAPCRHEMPSLERLQSRLGDKITVLAVSEDAGGSKVVAPFIAKLGLSAVKIYLDPESRVGQAFHVRGLPTSFLVDGRGRVRGRVEGEAAWNSPKMLAVIEPLLAGDGIVKTADPPAHP